jgi:hypothetical protein
MVSLLTAPEAAATLKTETGLRISPKILQLNSFLMKIEAL